MAITHGAWRVKRQPSWPLASAAARNMARVLPGRPSSLASSVINSDPLVVVASTLWAYWVVISASSRVISSKRVL